MLGHYWHLITAADTSIRYADHGDQEDQGDLGDQEDQGYLEERRSEAGWRVEDKKSLFSRLKSVNKMRVRYIQSKNVLGNKMEFF